MDKECSTCTDRLNYISLCEKYDQLESRHEVLLQDNLTYEEQIVELEKKLENIEKQTRKEICNEIKEKIFEMAFNVNNEEIARFSLQLMEYIINVVQNKN